MKGNTRFQGFISMLNTNFKLNLFCFIITYSLWMNLSINTIFSLNVNTMIRVGPFEKVFNKFKSNLCHDCKERFSKIKSIFFIFKIIKNCRICIIFDLVWNNIFEKTINKTSYLMAIKFIQLFQKLILMKLNDRMNKK